MRLCNIIFLFVDFNRNHKTDFPRYLIAVKVIYRIIDIHSAATIE